MAIKHRRGNYGDFDPSRMQQAELAVVLKNDTHTHDGKSAYIAFAPGVVKRIAMMDDIQEDLETAVQGVADTATAQANAAATRAETAATNAASSASSAASTLANVYTKQEVDAAIAGIEIDVDTTLTQQGEAADAKATGDAISELNGALDDLKNSGISDDVKEALLACFEHVAWADANGKNYYDALAVAIDPYDEIDAGKIGNYSLWVNTYPYYSNNQPTRLAYKDFDVGVVGGGVYSIKAKTIDQNVNMFIHAYNQNVLDAFETHSNITAQDHLDILGGWSNGYEHTIVVPKKLNNSPVAGLVFGFRYSDDSNINAGAVRSIAIKELSRANIPSGYTVYDYISANGTGGTVDAGNDGLIRTATYENLNHANIVFNYLATNNLASGNNVIMGVRANNNWQYCVAFYAKGDLSYVVYSHDGKTIQNGFSKNVMTHVELKTGKASPSIFISNGAKTEIPWAYGDHVINAPLYLLVNSVVGDSAYRNISSDIQLGQFVIQEDGKKPDIYIPVVRNSDNVIGIFNATTQQFYTCSNTNKAKVGHSSCAWRVGNWA